MGKSQYPLAASRILILRRAAGPSRRIESHSPENAPFETRLTPLLSVRLKSGIIKASSESAVAGQLNNLNRKYNHVKMPGC